MTEEEIEFKEEISKRFYPVSYRDQLHQVDDVFQGLDDIAHGEEKYNKDFVDSQGPDIKFRFDLYRKYLGLPQYNDLIQPSSHRPTRETNSEAEYFTFEPKHVLKGIDYEHARITSFQSTDIDHKDRVTSRSIEYKSTGDISMDESRYLYEGKTFDDLVSYVEEKEVIPPNACTDQLGNYKAYIGYDEERNERYVSYYDVWDIDPPQLKQMGIDVDQFNFPFEIYGRVYESDFENYLTDKKSESNETAGR